MHARIHERRSEGGFTLIELLVVMIIIAILMAVAVPTFLAQKNTAQKTKATANIKQIVNAIESCAANNTDGTYRDCTGFTGAAGTTPPVNPPNLKNFEKGLIALGGGPAALNTYQVTPSQATNAQGYMVQTMIKDGDVNVYFAEIHYENGRLQKACRGGTAFSVVMTGATAGATPAGAAVPGSRTCTNGLWG